MGRLKEQGYQQPFTGVEDGVGDYVRTYLSQPDPYR
jgi:ADP-L-glycero-D-manno-heptose 6-epimerase